MFSFRHLLVTSSTQTDLAVCATEPSHHSTPVHHRLGNLQGNISSSSSTSGAVDLDLSCSNSSKSETFPRRREGVKSVHIVETVPGHGVSSFLEPDDSSTLRRNSFKRAIERGQSLESSQSFDADPGSGETTPDWTDHLLPPVTTIHKDNAGFKEVGFVVHHCTTQEVHSKVTSGGDSSEALASVCQHPPEYYTAVERSRSLSASKATTGLAEKHKTLEGSSKSGPKFLPKWTDTSDYFDDHRGDFQSSSGLHLDMNSTEDVCDNQAVINVSQDSR